MKVDLQSLIRNAVKHQKKPESSGLSQFAPKIEAAVPEPAPAAETPVKKVSDRTQEKIQE
jgi:hypothetical protein